MGFGESVRGKKNNSLRKKEGARNGKTLSSTEIKGKMCGVEKEPKMWPGGGRKSDSLTLFLCMAIERFLALSLCLRHQPGVRSWEKHLNN